MARVLLVFEPPDGGVAEHVAQLAAGLARAGHEVEVAGPEQATPWARLDSEGIPIHRVALRRGYGRPWRDAAALWALIGLVRRGRFDLVHCHSAKAGVLGRLAARATRVPALYTPHCFGFVGDVSRGRRAFAIAVERALGPRTAAIVCACDAERGRALEQRVAPEARLRRIYYGTEPCAGDVAADAALLELRGDGPLAAAIAVLREQKRIDLLLDATPRVLARVPDARIAVVGNGPLREPLLERAAALGLDREPRFAFLPFESPPARYLRALDVFVLPSAWEAMPIAVLEALACGVPQIATDVEGTGEAVGPETGVLVPPRDVDALVEALVALLSDPERRARLAAGSRARHAERFSIERMVGETAHLYAEVLAGD